jgi:hypothetical protein
MQTCAQTNSGYIQYFKYHIVSEFINFSLLTATFSNIRKRIKKTLWKEINFYISPWKKTYYTIYKNEVVNW